MLLLDASKSLFLICFDHIQFKMGVTIILERQIKYLLFPNTTTFFLSLVLCVPLTWQWGKFYFWPITYPSPCQATVAQYRWIIPTVSSRWLAISYFKNWITVSQRTLKSNTISVPSVPLWVARSRMPKIEDRRESNDWRSLVAHNMGNNSLESWNTRIREVGKDQDSSERVGRHHLLLYGVRICMSIHTYLTT